MPRRTAAGGHERQSTALDRRVPYTTVRVGPGGVIWGSLSFIGVITHRHRTDHDRCDPLWSVEYSVGPLTTALYGT